MYEGGSLVYFDKLFKPSKLVGVDCRLEPIAALEEYREKRSHIATYYGRFQDKAGVLQAARQNFPKGIDLVVDDASHLFAPTKATFQMLFPLVRTGGHYVIERWRKSRHGFRETAKPPLAMFVHELMALTAKTTVIERVIVSYDAVCVRKGVGSYNPQAFDLEAAMREHGLFV